MDEHGNGLNEEQMAVLTDMALEWGGAVDITYRQCGNDEIAIRHEWDFLPRGWTNEENADIVFGKKSPTRILRTIDAWNRVSEMHPKGKLQGVKIDAPQAKICWVKFVPLQEFYELMASEAPIMNQKGSNDKDN